MFNKLNKEKKHISENGAKAAEDLQVASDKVEHLNKVKQKLEVTLDELEGGVEKEKIANFRTPERPTSVHKHHILM